MTSSRSERRYRVVELGGARFRVDAAGEVELYVPVRMAARDAWPHLRRDSRPVTVHHWRPATPDEAMRVRAALAAAAAR